MAGTYHHLFKIILVGDPGVGKGELLTKFEEDGRGDDKFISTIGIPFRVRDVHVGRTVARLHLWCGGWGAGWEAITAPPDPTRAVRAVLVVYNVTSEESYENTRKWLRRLKKDGDGEGGNVVLLLLGNNGHCQGDDRQVTWQRGKELGAEVGIKFLEVSVVTGLNMDETLLTVTKAILARVEKVRQLPRPVVPVLFSDLPTIFSTTIPSM